MRGGLGALIRTGPGPSETRRRVAHLRGIAESTGGPVDQCVRTRERWPGKTPKETTVGFRGETCAAHLVARHLDLEQAVHSDMESAERERESPTGKGPASRLAIAIPRETRAARGVGGRSQLPTCSSFRGQASRNTSGPDSLQASNSFFRFPPEIPHLNQTAHPKLSRSCHRVIGRCARSARAITRSAGNPHRAWCSRESGKPPRSAERSARRLSRPVVLADEVSRAPPRTSRN